MNALILVTERHSVLSTDQTYYSMWSGHEGKDSLVCSKNPERMSGVQGLLKAKYCSGSSQILSFVVFSGYNGHKQGLLRGTSKASYLI